MAKKYYWLRLKDDFFKQKEIKKLRKIAGGDTYVIIYLKMQLLSLTNEGKLFFDGVEDNFIEELALELDEEVENVKMTFLFLEKHSLLEVVEHDELLMTKVPELIGSESESKERVKKWREKKRLESIEASGVEQVLLNDTTVTCNAHVTECNVTNVTCNTEIEKEIEKEKEIEIEKNIEKENIILSSDTFATNDFVEVYMRECFNLPQIRTLTDKRKKAINSFKKTYKMSEWEEVCKIANNTDFLIGKNDRGWKADFDFLINVNNATKVLEGKYTGGKTTQTQQSDTSNPFFDLLKEEGKM